MVRLHFDFAESLWFKEIRHRMSTSLITLRFALFRIPNRALQEFVDTGLLNGLASDESASRSRAGLAFDIHRCRSPEAMMRTRS